MEANKVFLFCCTLIMFITLITNSEAVDTISANQTIRDDGNSTLESAGGAFELGFFSPGNSKNRYLGIWYKSMSAGTVVWVANRETPITDNSGVFKVDTRGNLVLTNVKNGLIWSSNSSQAVRNPVAQLLDSGNLVVRYDNETDAGTFLWQSFDHPGDHLLPGMALGLDLVSGVDHYLSSWKRLDDPSPGNYTWRLSLSGFPQLFTRNGSVLQFRFGPWDGTKFSGTAFDKPTTDYISMFNFDQNAIYYHFSVNSNSSVMRVVLNYLDGNLQILSWTDQAQGWQVLQSVHKDECDTYALCGAYGTCEIAKSQSKDGVCGCLQGFEPKVRERWKLGDWSDGCARRTQLGCGPEDAFISYVHHKLPDSSRSWYNKTMNIDDCRIACLSNCSCTAYSNIDIREGGVGCILWFDDLLDIRDYKLEAPDLYVRVAASELARNRSSGATKKVVIIVVVVSVILVALLGLLLRHLLKKRKQRTERLIALISGNNSSSRNKREDLELPLFDFPSIVNATNDFSNQNKLGEGGFGPVYKGTLEGGQEIAVKRLSKNSKQGLDEFKNEVLCIAKLQHRNLVRLLGCCIENGEMLLIYEFMPNNSLDSLIFGKELRRSLDWPKRYNIVNGIARGLLYLHQDSRLRIIHRDLKASNILLDRDMNPRISDFGLARSFGGTEIEANTTRVVGTYGYMSPEYALDGIFSIKSDVYSFGVLVLETVSGMKMRGFYHPDANLNLLSNAWRLYKEGKFIELVDQAIVESSNESEVLRAIKIGLLCVQPYPDDRPSMSQVVLMLSSEIELSEPKQPAFFTERLQVETDFSKLSPYTSSSKSLSRTVFSPR